MKETRKDNFDQDLRFIREQLLADANNVELPESLRGNRLLGKIQLPDSLRSEQLLELLDEENQPESKPGTWKKHYLQFFACAACTALMFFGFYRAVQIVSPTQPASELGTMAAPAAIASSSPAQANSGLVANDVERSSKPNLHNAVAAVEQPMASSYDQIYDILTDLSSKSSPVYHGTPNPTTSGSNANPSTAGYGETPVEDFRDMAQYAENNIYQTNPQVVGVDEGDIIKTDGSYIYQYRFNNQTSGAQIAIVGATNLKLLSTIELDEYTTSAELYLFDNFLTVVQSVTTSPDLPQALLQPISSLMRGSSEDQNFQSQVSLPDSYDVGDTASRPMTVAVVYDISNHQMPLETYRFSQDGVYVSSRMENGVLYLVTNKSLACGMVGPSTPAWQALPMVEEQGTPRLLAPTDIFLPAYMQNTSYAVVSSIKAASQTATTRAVLGLVENIMMSADSLFLTASIYPEQQRGQETCITRFVVGDADLQYIASGSVPGLIDSQFSLDEYNGNLRVATTSRNDKGEATNGVYVLNETMQILGKVENLAPGKRIYSARFRDDVGYVMTFRQTNPLFIIDLSDPTNPTVKGQVKIPEFPEYLHPVDKNTLVGLGMNMITDPQGTTLQDGLKLSLFDVSDPTDPIEKSSLLLGNRGSNSEALQNHHAVMYDPERRYIGFPATLYMRKGGEAGDIWSGVVDVAFSGYLVLSIEENGFSLLGKLDNSGMNGGIMRTDVNDIIQRGFYIGDTFYTSAPGRLVAYDIKSFNQIGELVYPS
ncbi:MAG: beta-propeller domain-containing protein [Oscillospiraceae bacterium]